MSLKNYRKKRNFKNTSEPSASVGQGNGVLHFVVQEHHASHLHYDFRLEHRGVLKSWAVPKGVSDDPAIKRLAIEVEDHPLNYRHFEGTIPKGNYGAGTVEILDKGDYYVDKELDRKENEKKIQEDLQKGHLKFYLNGAKLHGLYSLVKLHGRTGKDNQWLLIKKREDEDVQENVKELTKKSSKNSIQHLPVASMPSMVKPMLATLTAEPFDRKGWIFEVKWDGYRILAEIKKHKVRLYTRNGQDYTTHFPQVVSELKSLPDVVLDGEMVVVDEQGVSRFQLLQNYMRHKEGQLLYYVFDLIFLQKYDLHRLPLKQRKEKLHELISGTKTVRLSDYVEERGTALYKEAKKNGLEGVIAKNLESSYDYGTRSLNWLKIKAIQEQEAIICGFTAPRGSRKHFGALILGVYKGKELRYVGHTGGGFDDDLLKSIYNVLKPLITTQCPFAKTPKTNAPATWIKPKILCEVKFQEWTDDGHMRQPIFLGLREDKKPKQVEKEMPKSTKEVLAKTREPEIHAPKTKAELSNLEKVYWPEEGYTKGEMIQYYQDVVPYILPHLKGRPQSLHRQPNGINDQGFFQKDINFKPPPWLQIMELESESKNHTVHYLVCQDKDSLAYMNNLGCIEINPWCSTVQSPHHPDFLVLDFDPVDVPFPKVIDTVLTARDILIHIKCDGFVKTSGSRGMHIYIPLKRKYTFDQTKDFCQVLCLAINNKMPKLTSLERSPEKRKGLIYLDYLQNHFSASQRPWLHLIRCVRGRKRRFQLHLNGKK